MTEQYTYASTQATKCACCGVHKHTPLRVDFMGGYVCLTCIDMRLEVLDDTATMYAKQVAHWIGKHDALQNLVCWDAPKVNALIAERDALAAKLAALEKQEPVAWRWGIRKLSGSYEWRYSLNKTQDDAIPLYTAAGAKEKEQ